MNLEWGTIVKSINWTLVFNLVNFALLLWVLKRLLYRPVLTWLDRRRAAEERRLRQAAQAEAEAQQLQQAREAELSRANRRAREIVAQAEAEAQQTIRRAKDEARRQVQVILEDAEQAAQRLQAEAMADLRRAYAQLVVAGATQVLRREVQPADHQQLIAELAQRIPDQLRG
ncbi:MAG: F0F1 ATP synthase subunit B [Candidatus Bipolaricaulaceae bacterium]